MKVLSYNQVLSGNKMKNPIFTTLLFSTLALPLIIAGCSSTGLPSPSPSPAPGSHARATSYPVEVGLSDSEIKTRLTRQLSAWRGVPYRYGGLSKKGVDCSGFIYLTFRDSLGITLPRSTKLLSNIGDKVSKKSLTPGDLVFFKTTNQGKTRHVGIYVGAGEFIHASTSKGVMRSKLSNPYWRSNYWKARRVIRN